MKNVGIKITKITARKELSIIMLQIYGPFIGFFLGVLETFILPVTVPLTVLFNKRFCYCLYNLFKEKVMLKHFPDYGKYHTK